MSWLFSLYNFYKYLVSTRKGNKWHKGVLLISDLSGVKMNFYKCFIKEYEDCQNEFWSLCKQLRNDPELKELHDEYINKYSQITTDAMERDQERDMEEAFFPEMSSGVSPWDSFQTMQLLKELNSEYKFKLLTNI